MPTVAITPNCVNEITILARILGNDQGALPASMARYILKRTFSASDKTRMHDLVTRNQDDDLSAVEKEELLAYAKAGTMLSILKSRARCALRMKPKKQAS